MTTEHNDALVFTSDRPNVSEIIKEFQSCGQQGDYFNRSTVAENTRFARWSGQSDDGKKHAENLDEGEEVFPFDGASDVRCYQSDEICNEAVAVDLAAFWRSKLRVTPIGVEDVVQANAANKYMDWMRKAQVKELEAEVELSSQFRHGHSWCALHVTWEREVAKKLRKVSMVELIQTQQALLTLPADQIPPQYGEVAPLLAIFPDLIARPDSEDQAVAALKVIYRTYVKQGLNGVFPDDDIPELSNKRARTAIRELREKKETELPWPYLCKNQSCIRALKPWRDIVVNNYCAEIQQHPYIFLPIYFAENEFRAMAKSDGWDSDFVDAAVKTVGRVSAWGKQEGEPGKLQTIGWNSVDAGAKEIELLWVYQKLIDDDGIAGVYFTICSPHIEKRPGDKDLLCAKHGLLNYPGHEYPIVILPREKLDRYVTATRSVPELAMTSQREEKVQHDALADLTSLAVVPPLNIPKGTMQTRYKHWPNAQNEVTSGREPKYMDVPTRGMVPAIELLKLIDYRKSRYFGLRHEEVPPDVTMLFNEKAVRTFLSCWGKAFSVAYLLACKFAPDMVERITGARPPNDMETAKYDCVLQFDPTALNNELLKQKLDAYSTLIPDDTEGVLDRSKLVRHKANYISPELADELVTDKETGNEKLMRDTQADIGLMFLGNQATLRDASNDPTAAVRLQYALAIIKGNPKYLAALSPELAQQLFPQPGMAPQFVAQNPDFLFNEALTQYLENMQMGVEQMRNKQVGRTGVKQ